MVSKMDEPSWRDQGRRPVQRGLEDARPGQAKPGAYIEGNDKLTRPVKGTSVAKK
jgi:hypothetical protein